MIYMKCRFVLKQIRNCIVYVYTVNIFYYKHYNYMY